MTARILPWPDARRRVRRPSSRARTPVGVTASMPRTRTLRSLPSLLLCLALLMCATAPPVSAQAVVEVPSATGPIIELPPLSIRYVQPGDDRARVGDVTPERVAGAMTRISGLALERGRQTLGDVLEAQVGADVRRSGGLGSLSLVSLRGANSEQVNVFLDGVLLNAASGGGVNLANLELAEVEAIEVYRGFTPIELGRPGLGGAINIRTERVATTTSLKATLGGGSLGSAQASVLGGVRLGGWQSLASLSARTSDNDFEFINDNGTPLNPDDDRVERRRNADVDQASGLFKLARIVGSDRRLSGQFQVFAKDQALPALNNAPVSTQFDTRRYQLRARVEGAANAERAWASAFEGVVSRTVERFDDAAGELGLGTQRTRDTTDLLGVAAFAEHVGRSVIPAGRLDVRYEQYRSVDALGSRSDVDNSRLSIDLALQTTGLVARDRLRIVPALRAQWVDDSAGRAAASNADGRFVTGSLGLRLDLGPTLTLRTQAGRYVRVPSLFELYGDRGLLIGNPELEPERGTNVDVGLVWAADPRGAWLDVFTVSASVFHNRSEDLIVRTFDARGIGQSQNVGAARIQGAELALDLSLAARTSIALRATVQDPENRSDLASLSGKRLPGRVQESVDVRLVQGWRRWSAFYDLSIERGRFYDSANLLAAEDQTLHALGVDYQRGGWRAAVSIDNLSNDVYEDFNGFPRPGRTILGTVSYQREQR